MRTLYLCRHAKSSWADPGQDDHDRPLNERGLHDAPMMARLFKERNEPVDRIVSSTALRALTTARSFAQALQFDAEHFAMEPRLYHASTTTINHVVNALPGSAQRAILFGHNPGFTEALEHFTGESLLNMPTCGLARIDFLVDDWDLVGRHTGTLVWFDHPKAHYAPGQ